MSEGKRVFWTCGNGPAVDWPYPGLCAAEGQWDYGNGRWVSMCGRVAKVIVEHSAGNFRLPMCVTHGRSWFAPHRVTPIDGLWWEMAKRRLTKAIGSDG